MKHSPIALPARSHESASNASDSLSNAEDPPAAKRLRIIAMERRDEETGLTLQASQMFRGALERESQIRILAYGTQDAAERSTYLRIAHTHNERARQILINDITIEKTK